MKIWVVVGGSYDSCYAERAFDSYTKAYEYLKERFGSQTDVLADLYIDELVVE